jgi:hypothetical protein
MYEFFWPSACAGILKVFSSIFLFARILFFCLSLREFFCPHSSNGKIDEHGALLAGNVKQLPEIRLNEDLPLKI